VIAASTSSRVSAGSALIGPSKIGAMLAALCGLVGSPERVTPIFKARKVSNGSIGQSLPCTMRAPARFRLPEGSIRAKRSAPRWFSVSPIE